MSTPATKPFPAGTARRLASVGMVVCAAPAYLKRHGTPRTPGELAGHRTLGFSYLWTGDDRIFEDAQRHLTTVRVNADVHATDGDVLRELAVAGEGIVLHPNFLVGTDVASGALVPLLAEFARVHAVGRGRLVQAHEGIGVVPVPAGPVSTIDHHDVGVGAAGQQGVDKGHADGAGADDEVVGCDRCGGQGEASR
jgi:DNA-binding transcriptional LysR family regulator